MEFDSLSEKNRSKSLMVVSSVFTAIGVGIKASTADGKVNIRKVLSFCSR